MLQALREIEGGIQLSLNVAARLPHLRRPPILESFLRQVYFTGVTAATGVILRACGLGVIIIAVTRCALASSSGRCTCVTVPFGTASCTSWRGVLRA